MTRARAHVAKLAAEGGGTLVDSAAEAEAADVRQQEFFAVRSRSAARRCRSRSLPLGSS